MSNANADAHTCQTGTIVGDMTSGFAMLQELQEELAQLGCGREDFDWAVAVLHSRCFVEGPNRTHMVVPGVDMANHAFMPNAAVRFITAQHFPRCPLSCVALLSCKSLLTYWPRKQRHLLMTVSHSERTSC